MIKITIKVYTYIQYKPFQTSLVGGFKKPIYRYTNQANINQSKSAKSIYKENSYQIY